MRDRKTKKNKTFYDRRLRSENNVKQCHLRRRKVYEDLRGLEERFIILLRIVVGENEKGEKAPINCFTQKIRSRQNLAMNLRFSPKYTVTTSLKKISICFYF